MRKKIILPIAILIVLLLASLVIFKGSGPEEMNIFATVQRGSFDVLVYSSGQLEAENSDKIVVPESLRDRNIRIYEIKITDLVEEGTVVDSGQYVASLDHKAVEEVLIGAQEDLELWMNNFEDAMMDSNLTLSNQRDLIINAREDVEEMQIVLDESRYESPAVIRKAEMDLEKAKRRLAQEIKGYELKERQAASRVERTKIELRQRQTRVDNLITVYNSLKIYAPRAGMVIYGRDRSREKIKVGSTVSPWSPIIATLPDMSTMQSITYINEIDISRVKTGQKVTLGVDAIPEKVLDGEVVAVANIGQQMPKSDAKVFEVKIRVLGDVSDLKPAMTTSNVIQTGNFSDTLFIPSECVYENDSLQYVFLEEEARVVKKVVDLGDENENYVLIRKGLEEGDRLLLTMPDNEEEIPLTGLELYAEIKERLAREEAEAAKNQKENSQGTPLSPDSRKGENLQNESISAL